MVYHFSLRRRVRRRVLVLRRCIRRVMDRLLSCCLGKPVHYRMLPISAAMSSPSSTFAPSSPSSKSRDITCHHKSSRHESNKDSDLVALKISLLGDSQIGKTSFVVINPSSKFIYRTKLRCMTYSKLCSCVIHVTSYH